MKSRLLLRFALMLSFFGCTKHEPSTGPLAGGASDTETAFIQGTLIGADNIKKPGLMVHLYSVDYNPLPNWERIDSTRGFCDSTVTDSNGFFRFDTISKGLYNLVVLDMASNYGIYIDSIEKKENTAIKYDSLCMLKNGVIHGTAPYHDWVFIKGTGFYSSEYSDYSFNNIPVGTYSLSVVWVKATTCTPPNICPGGVELKCIANISVIQDSTTVVDTVEYH